MTSPPPPAAHRESYGSDPLTFGDLYLPSAGGPHPVVILIHGGCWRARHDLSYIGPLAAALAHLGLAVWSLEYRRIGNPGGGWPGTFQDVARGADHLRNLAGRFPFALGRVLAVGHSAGGHLALWLAGRRRLPGGSVLATDGPLPLKGVVSLAGIPDLARAALALVCGGSPVDLMGGAPDRVSERYAQGSPSALIPLGVPQRLIHGAGDDLVPVAYVRPYESQAREAGDDVRMTIIPEVGHFELTDPTSVAWPTVRHAILELAGPTSGSPSP